MEKTVTILFNGNELTVTGDYQKEEPMVMYYSDGSGHPGSPAEFETTQVEYEGVSIFNLLESLGHLEEIDSLALDKINEDY